MVGRTPACPQVVGHSGAPGGSVLPLTEGPLCVSPDVKTEMGALDDHIPPRVHQMAPCCQRASESSRVLCLDNGAGLRWPRE